MALLPIIDALPNADPQHIGLWGVSRGGMMSYLAARRSDRFSAMVIHGGPVDLEKGLERRPEMEKVFKRWIPDYEESTHEALRQRSALFFADKLPESLPILLLHGAEDQRVSALQALHMAEKLQELKRRYRLVIYEQGSHGLHEHEKEVHSEIISWFTRYLKTDESLRKSEP